jgi:hypothetical protein
MVKGPPWDLSFLGKAGEAGKESGKMGGIRGEGNSRIHRLSGISSGGMVAIEDGGAIGRNMSSATWAEMKVVPLVADFTL